MPNDTGPIREYNSAELVEIVATPIVRDEDDNFLSVVTKELRRPIVGLSFAANFVDI